MPQVRGAAGSGCGDELLFSFLQMVSAMCMSMCVSAFVWKVSPSQLF